MITRTHFLSFTEAQDIKSRLFENKHLGLLDKLDIYFGAGIDFSHRLWADHDERMIAHNAFMKSVFPDLLEKLKLYFENLLGRPCYYADELSYPGFHIFGIEAKTSRPLWFHFDEVRSLLQKDHPQFGVTESSRQITYTALLDSPSGLTAGLLYFPQEHVGIKVIKSGESRNSEMGKFATLHEYALGEMNYYERPVHSVYGRNDSDIYVDRVTFQGHLIETNRGFLLFR